MRFRVGRYFGVAAGIVTVCCVINLACHHFIKYDDEITKKGSFLSDPAMAAPAAVNSSDMGNPVVYEPPTQPDTRYQGYQTIDVSASQDSSSLIAVVDEAHPAPETASDSFVSLFEKKNDFYSIRYEGMEITDDAAYAFNTMMQDYNATTKLKDFVVYNTTESDSNMYSPCCGTFPESALGNCVDLAIMGINGVIAYDGRDEEKWVVENCAAYGFIVRFPEGKSAATGHNYCPWHLRYVGTLYAAVMRDNNLTLEEFNDWIKSYTLDTAPYEYTLGGITYKIYYAASMGDATQIKVPRAGNYTIMSNNIDGYVISAIKK